MAIDQVEVETKEIELTVGLRILIVEVVGGQIK